MAGKTAGNQPKRRGPGRPFVKGQSGNPKGKPKGTLGYAAKLKAALLAAVTENDMEEIADGLMKGAKRGNPAAAKELFDRLWGKAPQAVELTGNEGGPIKIDANVKNGELERIAKAILLNSRCAEK